MSEQGGPGASHALGSEGDEVRREVTIINRRGLHARAAAKFVKLASQFTAEIEVSSRGQAVSGRSIMGLMMLAAAPGVTIEITARGSDAAAAMQALVALVEGKFEEE